MTLIPVHEADHRTATHGTAAPDDPLAGFRRILHAIHHGSFRVAARTVRLMLLNLSDHHDPPYQTGREGRPISLPVSTHTTHTDRYF